MRPDRSTLWVEMAAKRPPRGKSLEQQAKGAKPRRKPTRLTARQRIKRDNEVVHDRLVSDLSWASIAKKYGISERQAHRIVSAYAKEQSPSIEEIDPTEEVWEALQSDDAAIERLRDTRTRAIKQNNLNAEIGAERTDGLAAQPEVLEAPGGRVSPEGTRHAQARVSRCATSSNGC